MKWFFLLFILLSISCKETNLSKSETFREHLKENWQASWITTQSSLPTKNAWVAFRKLFELKKDSSSVKLHLAVDSKYWLWINGELVIFEGGLKRGPTPNDTYYDEVDISEALKNGKNTIAILVWYFGKEGMTHKSSGKAGLIAEIYQNDQQILQSDNSWKVIPHPAYISKSEDPQPNWRLPESNIVFDAQKELTDWIQPDFNDSDWLAAKVICDGICPPWNQLVKRPIPFWKDFGLKAYENQMSFPFVNKGDTIKCKLSYNAQVTPFLKIKAKAGEKITMFTDHYKGGSAYNMRAEYITKEGEQTYESFGWINGEEMYYIIPDGVEILELKYRESGYDTEFSGIFSCNDTFYNRLWEKAKRTLYVTMRDNYMDCPDRERAQWWGDVVLESGEAFYALDRKADALTKKGMLELMNWQCSDSTIFSPVPAGNWDKELPGQMLASVGYYGFWNYYLHTGDLETIKKVYEPVKHYLSLWKLKKNNTIAIRKGGWTWGDWGQNKDVPLLMNTQYYLALKGYKNMSEVLGNTKEVDSVTQLMKNFKIAFNTEFWKKDHYRSQDYLGKTDDRSQGLAVVSGIADPDKYEAIYKILQTEKHASPYMEKYILEALYIMGYEDFALQRMKERFGNMVNHPEITTLWEGWGIGAEGFGGGTTNHAWSGGGLTLLSQYAAGIAPTSPGYKTFQIKPQPGFLKNIKATVPSIKGDIKVELKNEETYSLNVTIPKETKATIYIPSAYKEIRVNNAKMIHTKEEGYNVFEISAGVYEIKAN
ncbi:alpha-L-rhamnosidase C-terminal domain-containing protein [uncultured Aquimarina sp.]|uniref:alpha-L-rhamnosidase-related protein n=1 Tax=uncultured Aquimarina sp. TaxID=575652 RepID=UPI00261C51C9|nr:alpha-L-rhamnosidase C-terminal domain-containing protein [uncultured Aquimarina sp.]